MSKTCTSHNSDSSDEEDDTVVQFSCNQRAAIDEEPQCIVCSRYGAYICDTYDVDVCSKECKSIYHGQKEQTSIQKSLKQHCKRLKVDKVCEYSSEQRPALPHEPKCIRCSRYGVLDVLDSGKVCSIQCRTLILTPDEIIQSPKLSFHPDLNKCQSNSNNVRKSLEIQVVEGDAAPPITDFSQVNLNTTLQHNLAQHGYKVPTAVQSQCISCILDGSDVLVSSGPGSGKTLSYLLPVIHRVSYWSQQITKTDVLCLILAPTRELAIQIENITKDLCKDIPFMKTALVVGGLSSTTQNYRIESGVQIIIGTPGRIIEIAPELSKCYTLVLDECDVMLDQTFHEQVKKVIQLLPARHQTLMFSATVSDETRKYAKLLLYHPVIFSVGNSKSTLKNVKQIVLWVENDSKKKKLVSILQDSRYDKTSVLVFVESKFGALLLADFLINKDILCAVIHGNKTQEDRMKIVSELESGKYHVLISTNLLGRGLVMPTVSNVVLFDMPSNMEMYVHQVGRCVSRNKQGTAFVFVNSSNKNMFLPFYEMTLSKSVSLPNQLLNSPHLAYQKQEKLLQISRAKNNPLYSK